MPLLLLLDVSCPLAVEAAVGGSYEQEESNKSPSKVPESLPMGNSGYPSCALHVNRIIVKTSP